MTTDRRSFLAGGAAVSAGLMLGCRGLGTWERSWRKAVKLGMVQEDLDLHGKFALLAELGFDGVELDSPSDLDPEEVIAARDATGLVIHGVVDSVHWQKPFSDPDPDVRAEGVAALETAIRDAHRYGGSTVLVVPAVVGGEVDYATAWRRSRTEIRRLLPLARELDVKLAFENVWNNFITEPAEAARYVDEFQSQFVGWYFDVGNSVRYGPPVDWVRALGRRILKIDVKGYSLELMESDGIWSGFQAEIGEGDADWPAVMAALDDLHLATWATAEVSGGDRDRLADIAARMDRVLGA